MAGLGYCHAHSFKQAVIEGKLFQETFAKINLQKRRKMSKPFNEHSFDWVSLSLLLSLVDYVFQIFFYQQLSFQFAPRDKQMSVMGERGRRV